MLSFTRSKLKAILIIGLLILAGLVLYITSTVNKQQTSLLSRASENKSIKIMTFNVLGEPICPGEREKMTQIVNFIKNNDITIAALQEVKEAKDDDDGACEYNFPENIKNDVTKIIPSYTTTSRQYISASQGSASAWWYRIFIHKTPMIGSMVTSATTPANSQGAEAILMDTNVGRIRFINIHPQPSTQALNLDKMLVPFINQFKADGIPMVIMGDTNLNYNTSNAAPILKNIEDAGFYRACNPIKFPSGNCDDTIKGTTNYAIDHIFIDKRALFTVKNAYVEQSMQFSDHLPVVIELQAVANAATPTPVKSNPVTTPSVPTSLWNLVKAAPGNVYPWTNGGPTAGWESYVANFVYICNGKYCWVLNRNNLTWNNNGSPIALDTDAGYSSLKASPNGILPWSNGGPTAAWTWIISVGGQTVNETMLCNGNYCWRYLRYPTGTSSAWRDGGSPIYLPTYNSVWSDSRITALWSGSGITVAWTDPVNGYVTMCNHNDCRSIDYKTWTWRYNGAKIQPYPSGVTEFNSAWTSPTTNIQSLCVKNSCWQYDIATAQFGTSPTVLISTSATNTPVPTRTPTKVPPTPTRTPTKPPATPTPKPVGSLRVVIGGTIPAGAQWKRTDEATTAWKNSSVLQTGIPVGTYTVQFKPVTGYTTPPNIAGISIANKSEVQKVSAAYVLIPTPTRTPTKKPTPTLTKVPPTPTRTPTKVPTIVATATKAPTPTRTPTKAPTIVATAIKIPSPTTIVNTCSRKAQGDADCNGIIDLRDAICWVLESQNAKPANCKSADFNSNGKVGTADLVEIGIWRSTYIKENTNPIR